MKAVLILLFVFLTANNVQAQQDYKPLKYSGHKTKLHYRDFEQSIDMSGFDGVDKDIARKYKAYRYELYLEYIAACKQKMFIEDARLQYYFQQILDEIILKNAIKEPMEIVLVRSLEANAYNMGEDKLYINIGILNKIQNEAQLAVMICHEMSHQLLQHVKKNFIRVMQIEKDKKVNKQFRDVRKATYNKTDRYYKLYKDIYYSFSSYSRAFEQEADSMAAVLISKTVYDLRQMPAMLKLIDSVDYDKNVLDIKKCFSSAYDSVKAEWLRKSENGFAFGNKFEYELDEDSASTHPDFMKRVAWADSFIKKSKYDTLNKQVFMQAAFRFDSMQYYSNFEMLELFSSNKRYAALFFYANCLMQQYANHFHLNKLACTSFYELLKAVKEHKVYEFIPAESPDHAETYNQLLRLIDRTQPDELEKLYKNYLSKHISYCSDDAKVNRIYNELFKL